MKQFASNGALVPDEAELAIVLRGDLAAILRFAANKKNPDVLSEAGVLGALLSQESLVAGAGSHLNLRSTQPLNDLLKILLAGDRSGLFRTAA
ncbi:hypothetical protein [Rhizobium sp. YTU87027]|uniref:hypothetical protein n=1 Tax=Rhizobium sp. YTU87027 TaxID=3417741 RepID=UPI003D69E5F0